MPEPDAANPDAATAGAPLAGLPFAEALGLRLIEAADGRAVVALPYDATQIGDAETGVVHGGAITTLLDTCCAVAALSSASRPAAVATLDLRIDYMRPATPGRGVTAVAEVFRESRDVSFVRATAHQGDPSDAVASAVAVFMAQSRAGDQRAGKSRRGAGS